MLRFDGLACSCHRSGEQHTTLGCLQPVGIPLSEVLSVVKSRVELLADNDFEPAALPRVNGLNLVGAAARLKPMKGVAFPVEIFPKFVYPLPVRVAGGSSQPLSCLLYTSDAADE